jgi:general secretion pathway protein D
VKKSLILLLSILILAAYTGCSSAAFSRGKSLFERGSYDEAVKKLEESVSKNPTKLRYKALLERAKLKASQQHFTDAQLYISRKDYDNALKELQITLLYDPSNQYAQDTLQNLVRTVEEEERKAKAGILSLEDMKKEAERQSAAPMIDPASNIPLVLKFNNAALKTILDAISKGSGVNFVYDEKAELSKKISVDFAKINMEQALDYIMQQTKHFYKVLDPHTLIVVPDNKQKREEYEEQVMRTFYLSNADAKEVFQLIRTVVTGKKMAMNKDLNSITIKDSPETVALCQKIIEANDKSVGEIVVDVELLEVNSTKLKTLGIDLTSKNLTIGPDYNMTKDKDGNATGIGNGPPIPLGKIDAAYKGLLYAFPIPNLIVKFLMSDTDSQVLAKPQLRVMEGKKASVHIGDRMPIPSSTSIYTGSGGTQSNYVPTTTFTYQDVGVKIEIEPRVHHNREVSLKITAEVSSVTGYVQSESALTAAQPIIGTRKVQTEIRLEDGEASLLAGLLREEDQNSFSGVPGIGDIPILRRLFGTNDTKKISTDVVLLLTPHIIRMPNITEEDMKSLWVGTESRPKLQGYRGETSFMPSPFEGEGGGDKTAGAEESPDAGDDAAAEEEKEPKKEENPNQNAKILMNPNSLNVVAGNPAVLSIVLVGVKDGKSARLEVEFPTDLLSFEGAEEGTFFKQGGSGESTFQSNEGPPGMISAGLAKSGDNGASGSGLLIRYKFKALKPGTARVNVASAQLIDSTGNPQTLAPVSCVVTVSGGGNGKKDKP